MNTKDVRYWKDVIVELFRWTIKAILLRMSRTTENLYQFIRHSVNASLGCYHYTKVSVKKRRHVEYQRSKIGRKKGLQGQKKNEYGRNFILNYLII
jgi:hypothetical protein